MPAIDAGRYDRQITIQSATETQSSTGYAAESWANLGTDPTVWAQVIQKSGREFFEADKVAAEVVTVFRIHYRSDLTNKMRIVYNSRNFDILEIKELGYFEALEIIAKAVE